jgi:hypothetical protein
VCVSPQHPTSDEGRGGEAAGQGGGGGGGVGVGGGLVNFMFIYMFGPFSPDRNF